MGCSPPGSSVHGILQARILEWLAISFSRGSSQHRIEPTSPALAERFITTEPPAKPSPFEGGFCRHKSAPNTQPQESLRAEHYLSTVYHEGLIWKATACSLLQRPWLELKRKHGGANSRPGKGAAGVCWNRATSQRLVSGPARCPSGWNLIPSLSGCLGCRWPCLSVLLCRAEGQSVFGFFRDWEPTPALKQQPFL